MDELSVSVIIPASAQFLIWPGAIVYQCPRGDPRHCSYSTYLLNLFVDRQRHPSPQSSHVPS